jgi:hypothetical protein
MAIAPIADVILLATPALKDPFDALKNKTLPPSFCDAVDVEEPAAG